MKHRLTLVLGLILLALSVVPCLDTHDESTKGDNQVTLGEHTDCDDHHNEENCSPLCVCSCCGISYIQMEAQIELDVLPVINPTLYGEYQSADISEVYFFIFQPPKKA